MRVMLSMVIMTVIAIMAIKVFIVIPSSYISNLYYEDHPRLRLGACAYVRPEYELDVSLLKGVKTVYLPIYSAIEYF